tara:strand:+ start:597 stop:2501 length:1905 start_codon:yes stop_codon:yes gene_type:complete
MNFSNYRKDIDGLRGISILLVIFYHFDYMYFKNGFIGVDIFIVISGYLVTNIILNKINNKNFSYTSFLLNRARRLLPTLTFCLFFSFFISYFLFTEELFIKFSKTLFYSVIYSANIFLWKNTNYFSGDGEFNPLLHIWSLNIEEQYYFIWPIFLIFLLFFTRKNKFIIYLILILLFGLSLFISILFKESTLASFYLLPFRLYEFLIGSFISFLKLNNNKVKYSNLFTVLGLILILISLLPFQDYKYYPYHYALYPCLGTALIITFNNKKSFLNLILTNKILIYFGLISYTLYVFHWPIIVFYKYMIFENISFLNSIYLILFIFIFSSLIYHKLELPIRRKILIKQDRNFLFYFFVPSIFLLFFNILIINNNLFINKINTKDYFKNEGIYAGLATKENHIYNYDKENQYNISIIGDSHARQYIYPIIALLENDKFNVKTNILDSCISLPNLISDMEIWADKNYIAKCTNHYKDFSKENRESEIILIAYRWYNLIKNKKNLDSDKFNSNLEKSIDKLINLFSEETKFIFIGNVPGSNYKWGYKQCLLRKIKVNQCRDKYNISNGEFYKYNKIFETIEKKYNRVIFLDPYEYLCNDSLCFNLIDNNIIYSDHAHLTKFSSNYFIFKNKNKIKKFIMN